MKKNASCYRMGKIHKQDALKRNILVFLACNTKNHIWYEQYKLWTEYKNCQFQQNCSKEWQTFFCIFFRRTTDNSANCIKSRANRRCHNTKCYNSCHQYAKVNRIHTNTCYHWQKDWCQQQEIYITIYKHTCYKQEA